MMVRTSGCPHIDEIHRADRSSHDASAHAELVRQVLTGGLVSSSSDRYVRDKRNAGAEMRAKRPRVQKVVERGDLGAAVVGHEKDVGARPYRITNNLSPTDGEWNRLRQRGGGLELRFHKAWYRVDWKDQGEVRGQSR